MKANSFGSERYLDSKCRLAFREFGTCLGIKCHPGRTADLQEYVEEIINAWEPYTKASLSAGGDPEDLRPINRAMYATALLPSGEANFSFAK